MIVCGFTSSTHNKRSPPIIEDTSGHCRWMEGDPVRMDHGSRNEVKVIGEDAGSVVFAGS